jgi:hypothetical protein
LLLAVIGGTPTLILHAKFPCDRILLLFTMSQHAVGTNPPLCGHASRKGAMQPLHALHGSGAIDSHGSL